MANIRGKFKGDKTLDGYHKKKYVCKLLFIFLLGHDVDFGHIEAVNLLSSNKYTEKQIGYLFISVLLNEGWVLALWNSKDFLQRFHRAVIKEAVILQNIVQKAPIRDFLLTQGNHLYSRNQPVEIYQTLVFKFRLRNKLGINWYHLGIYWPRSDKVGLKTSF